MADASSRLAVARPDGWAMLKRNRPAMISLGFLGFITVAAIIVPWLMPEVLQQTSGATFLPPLSRHASGSLHLCGTDVNGQDLFYRLLTGARVSLGIGLLGAMLSLLVGTVYGMVAGYVGGRVDEAMMRFVDVIYSVPRLLFIMVFISALDSHLKLGLDGMRLWAQSHQWHVLEHFAGSLLPYSKLLVMVISLGLVEWLTMARIVRGQVLVLREMAFVTAARAMGQGTLGILRKHLLPNLTTIVLTYLTLTIPAVILDESFLSFLGLGVEDPASSWGSLLKDGAQVINPVESKWWLLAFPAMLMSICLLALNFLGDDLREAFDPKSEP